MKKVIGLIMLALYVSAPSFAAEDVLGHTAKVAGKDSYKVAKTSAKDAGKASGKVVKFLF